MSNMTAGQAADIEEARRLRLAGERHPPQPSSKAMEALRKSRRGMTFFDALKTVEAEWIKQGRPYPEHFDWLPLGLDQNPNLESNDGN